ncbi:SUF system NifU family Fe-S cluster assembly protein [Candidatus Woesearchaeota archaeon]|nr:SUF system NifU family Fe-S cluster assembly protein [Candidatus Woesearchaeota archaeon]
MINKYQKQKAAFDQNQIGDGPLTEEQEIYRENIIDHYKNPHNKRKMDHCTFSRREFNPLCGDDVIMYVTIRNNFIGDAAFTGTGCAISQASVSLLTDQIKNKSLEEVKKMTRDDVVGMLGIPLSTVRLRCALLSLKALLKGIELWERGGK